MMHFGCKNESGFSLLEFVVAIGVASLSTAVLYKVSSAALKARRSIELSAELTSIRSSFATKVSCRETLQGLVSQNQTCLTGMLIALKDRSGKTLVAAPFGLWRGWTLQAQCAAGGGIKILAARFMPGKSPVVDLTGNLQNPVNDFVFDTGTRRPYDFNHPLASLFKTSMGGALCSAPLVSAALAPLPGFSPNPVPDGHSSDGISMYGKCKTFNANFSQNGFCPGVGGGTCQPLPGGGLGLTLKCPQEYPVAIKGQRLGCCGCQPNTSGTDAKLTIGVDGFPDGMQCRMKEVYDLTWSYFTDVCIPQGGLYNGHVQSWCTMTCCAI